ncbi:MAG: lamin tail domain-containing protein [Phycisphaerae bacterium]|jgi:hypothetical protein
MKTCASRRAALLTVLVFSAGFFLADPPSRALGPDCESCDVNGDRIINSADLDVFLGCVTGPAIGAPPGACALADLDADGDVDQGDFGLFQACIGRDLRPSPVFITELMAEENRIWADENGRYPDWIELYNAGPTSVDLSGWSLTDDPAVPGKWRFPSVQIAGFQHLVVFASGENRVGPSGELHTNFQLDAQGEYLALVKPDGISVASEFAPAYPKQKARVSYGLRAERLPTTIQLIAPGAACRYLVPSSDLGLAWTSADYPAESTWTPAHTGIGYDRSTAGPYEPLISPDGDVESLIYNRGKFTVYIRIPFVLSNPVAVTRLTLKMKYDDAFAAYLNGVFLLKTSNAADNLTWNARAKSGHEADPAVYDEFDVTAFAGLLKPGDNVLAIHGMNYSSNDADLSSDFLFMPELWIQGSSEGLYHDDQPRFFSPPTPQALNGSGYAGYVVDTKFSVDRGFYESPFQVTITTQTPGATIRYTTDGSAVTETNGAVYTDPITVGTTTTLRAAAFKPDWLPTNVDTHTYLFAAHVPGQPAQPAGFPGNWGNLPGQPVGIADNWIVADYEMDPDVVNHPAYSGKLLEALTSIPTVSLVTDVGNLFDPTTGVYSNKLDDGFLWERPASVEMIFPDGRPGFQLDCGVRIQGGTSVDNVSGGWKCKKQSMRLRFREIYGPTKLDFPLFPDSPVSSFNTFVLDAHMNYTFFYNGGVEPETQRSRAQYVRDSFAADLQNALGSLAPHNIFVNLYLDGLYWGLYELHERPDEDFCADYLGGEPEDYDVIKHDPADPDNLVAGDTTAYLAMLSLANAGLSSSAAYQQLEQQYLDIDDFIDYMIVHFYVGNTDWAHQNWYVGRSRLPGGRFRYFTWDAEHVLKNATDDVTGKNDPRGPTRVHQQLSANAEYRLRFADHVHRHFFNGGQLYVDTANPGWDPARPDRNRPAALYMRRIDEIDPAIILESARWGDAVRASPPYTRDVEWMTELNRLLTQWFPQRSGIVLQQFRNRGLYPTLAAPVFSQHGGAYSGGFLLTMSAPGPIRYTLDGSDPRLPGGTPSPTALSYAGPVPLSGTVRVKARTFSGGTWSALNEALFAPAAPPALRITEIMYHPPPGGSFGNDDYEFVEVQNVGTTPVQMEGVTLGGGVQFVFPSMELAPGAFVVVVEDPAAFAERYGPAAVVAGQYTGNLKNSNDTLRLSDALGQVILDFSYSDAWYPSTDGQGYSLCIRDAGADPQSWTDPGSWRASTAVLGSPGAPEP